MKPRVLAIPSADPSHWKWSLVSSRNWQNTASLFCAWPAVRRLSLVPASAPKYISSAPFTDYKSATMDRPLLDQRGVNGQQAQLLEGPSARLPAAWQFEDLQLKPNKCVRISACDLSAVFDCWEVSPQRAARNLVGPPRHWRSFRGPAFTEMRRELPSWHAGALPQPSVEKSKRARNMVPQLRNFMAAIGFLHKGIIAPWILPNKLTRISSALLRPFSRLGRCCEGRSRLIETLCIDDHIALSIERFRDRGRRPSPATSMMDSCSAV